MTWVIYQCKAQYKVTINSALLIPSDTLQVLVGMLFWCLCEDDEMEAIQGWIGKQPRTYTPSLWCWGSPATPLEIRGEPDNRLLSVRHGRKERAAVKAGVRLYTLISPPPHASGFISCSPLHPEHNMMPCTGTGSALQFISRVDVV